LSSAGKNKNTVTEKLDNEKNCIKSPQNKKNKNGKIDKGRYVF